ncbi:hypothetical protein JXO59_04960 [candidate division KSB1 bacterium]|nr:hypothetical protein [candidate division KSB1 bacterium]
MKKLFFMSLLWSGLLWLHCSQPNQPVDRTVPAPPDMIFMSGPVSVQAPAEIGQKADEVNLWFQFVTRMLHGVEGVEPGTNGNIFQWELALDDGDVHRHIKAVRRSDKSVDWTVVWNGQAKDGTIYNNRTIIIGKAGLNNLSQTWTFYDIINGHEAHKISWQKDNSGDIGLVYGFPLTEAEWRLANRTDDSGTFEYLLQSVRQFYAEWAANGSGSYIDYRSGEVQTGYWD